MILAHGVGRVYELPLPLVLYLSGAAVTVAASFLIRALMQAAPSDAQPKLVWSGRGLDIGLAVARVGAFVGLLAALALGVVTDEGGFSVPALLFWVGLIIGVTLASSVCGGIWRAIDPWDTIEGLYRIDDERVDREPPWWIGPLGLYALFWFELVSDAGFSPRGIVAALLVYSLLALYLRTTYGGGADRADPLAIIFGFASRIAPFELRDRALLYRGARGLAETRLMPVGLYVCVFLLLGSTTLDNVRETVAWTDLRNATGLDALSDMLVDSAALLVFGGLFLAPFMGAVAIARRSLGGDGGAMDTARRFGWSLIPIGIAYVLAHNAPLFIIGLPALLRALSDPLSTGANILGTAHLFEGFVASPKLVWFLEIAVIVGGHILAVVAAHRIAYGLGGSHRAAVASQYALTALMSLFTVATLWLLAQPLVV